MSEIEKQLTEIIWPEDPSLARACAGALFGWLVMLGIGGAILLAGMLGAGALELLWNLYKAADG